MHEKRVDDEILLQNILASQIEINIETAIDVMTKLTKNIAVNGSILRESIQKILFKWGSNNENLFLQNISLNSLTTPS